MFWWFWSTCAKSPDGFNPFEFTEWLNEEHWKTPIQMADHCKPNTWDLLKTFIDRLFHCLPSLIGFVVALCTAYSCTRTIMKMDLNSLLGHLFWCAGQKAVITIDVGSTHPKIHSSLPRWSLFWLPAFLCVFAGGRETRTRWGDFGNFASNRRCGKRP